MTSSSPLGYNLRRTLECPPTPWYVPHTKRGSKSYNKAVHGGPVDPSSVTEHRNLVASSYQVPISALLSSLPDTHYVLCVNYGTDVQVAITGTCHVETRDPIECAIGELKEEAGLTGELNLRYTTSQKGKTWWIYHQEVENLTAITDPGQPTPINDDATKKVAVVISGEKDAVISKMQEITHLRYSTDELVGIAAVSVLTLKAIIQHQLVYPRITLKL